MPISHLYDRLVSLPPPQQGVAEFPPLEIIAFNVSVTRRLRGWKQSTLADLAVVSLSTVERIERGERVQTSALEKIGASFNFEPGYYTAARIPLTSEQMASPEHESYSHLAVVQVSQLKTQPQMRALAACDIMASTPLDGSTMHLDLLKGLFENLELLRVLLKAPQMSRKLRSGSTRDIYRVISQRVVELRRQEYDVIAGVLYEPERDPLSRVGVVGITNRKNDPGAVARKILILDRRDFVADGPPHCPAH